MESRVELEPDKIETPDFWVGSLVIEGDGNVIMITDKEPQTDRSFPGVVIHGSKVIGMTQGTHYTFLKTTVKPFYGTVTLSQFRDDEN